MEIKLTVAFSNNNGKLDKLDQTLKLQFYESCFDEFEILITIENSTTKKNITF